MTKPPGILSIGCGNMGAAILSGIAAKHPEAKIVAVDPSVERARALLPDGADVSVVATPQEVDGFEPEVTLLAIKPQMLGELVAGPDVLPLFEHGITVSILAGIPLAKVAATLHAPRAVRVMPNLPALVSQGMTVGFAQGDLTTGDRALVQSLFEATGQFAWLDDEALIDTCTAVLGSGPGYVFAFAQHLEAAAIENGLAPQLARRSVAQMIRGAAEMLVHDERSAEELKQAVTSRGGTTEAGLEVLEAEAGLPFLLPAAVRGALMRAAELSSD